MDSRSFSGPDKTHLLKKLIKMPQCALPGTHNQVNTPPEKALE